MTGFLKLCTISFTIVVLFSLGGCVIFNWLAQSPKANQAYRDRCEDAVFRCAFSPQRPCAVLIVERGALVRPSDGV